MAEQVKQKLQKGKSYVTVVGKAKVTDKTYNVKQTSKTSDYEYSRMGLGIETVEGNVIFGEMMGGFSPSMNYPIKARTKEGDNVDVNWADRLNESVIETLNKFSTVNVGLVRDGDVPAEGEEDKRKLVIKRFMSPYDAIDYIKENLKDGTMIMAKGSYKFNKYKEEDQKKFEITDIYLSKQEEGFANFVQTVIIDEDSFSKSSMKDAKETGEVIISARAVDYVGKIDGKKIGKNMTFNFPFSVKINKENPEMTEAIVNNLFKVKKGKIREISIEGQIFEGYEQTQVSEKDIKISKDVQELIAMGLYSKEEAMQKMTVRGNKVSKMLFTRPFILKDKDDATKLNIDMNDDKYVPEDLYVDIEETKEDTTSTDSNDIQEETSNAGDNSWLGALGLGQ
ncbi:hypothetical protein [Viridibacillus arvi]|uniref:hypothetical protein n=1 Tax=Viridibacillus arvi TaxID=263475 RepID=UPI0034CFF612